MGSLASTALLLAALALPVVLFRLLRSRLRVTGPWAAAVAIVTGWALNVVWAYALTQESPQTNEETLSIALRFGWLCPTILVLLTWLVWRFLPRRAR